MRIRGRRWDSAVADGAVTDGEDVGEGVLDIFDRVIVVLYGSPNLC